MSKSRKGLRRAGLRSYAVDGRNGTIVIDKESPRRWKIRPAEYHAAFFFEEHPLLREARKAAEAIVRGKREFDPVLDLYDCLDGRAKRDDR